MHSPALPGTTPRTSSPIYNIQEVRGTNICLFGVEAPEKHQPVSSPAQSGTGAAWPRTQIRKAESSEEFIVLQSSSFQTAWKKKHSNAKTPK